jgi:hypothetical protein
MVSVTEIQQLINDHCGKYLNLSGKGITTDILKQLVFPDSLQILRLKHNQITSIDNVCFPDTLQHLTLHNNQITSIDIVYFPDTLQTLWLSSNQITSIDNICFPCNLQKLWLDNNQITSIDNVCFPDTLQTLWLSDNQITFGIKRLGWYYDRDCYLFTEDKYKRYLNIRYHICRRFIKRLRLSIIKNLLPFPGCEQLILGFI